MAAVAVEARPLVAGALRLLSLLLELLAPAHRQHCAQSDSAVLVQRSQRKAVRVALASGRILIVLHFINNYYGTHTVLTICSLGRKGCKPTMKTNSL